MKQRERKLAEVARPLRAERERWHTYSRLGRRGLRRYRYPWGNRLGHVAFCNTPYSAHPLSKCERRGSRIAPQPFLASTLSPHRSCAQRTNSTTQDRCKDRPNYLLQETEKKASECEGGVRRTKVKECLVRWNSVCYRRREGNGRRWCGGVREAITRAWPWAGRCWSRPEAPLPTRTAVAVMPGSVGRAHTSEVPCSDHCRGCGRR